MRPYVLVLPVMVSLLCCSTSSRTTDTGDPTELRQADGTADGTLADVNPLDGAILDIRDTKFRTETSPVDAADGDIDVRSDGTPDEASLEDETSVAEVTDGHGTEVTDIGEDLTDTYPAEVKPEVEEDLLFDWPDAGGELLMSEPVIVPNPANVLSCFVKWKTNKAASSRVEFHAPGEKHFFVESEASVKNHSLLVFGMHAQTSYQLRAVSVAEEGEEVLSDYLMFQTEALPFWNLLFEVTSYDAGLAEPGWVLANISGSASAPAVAIMADEGGIVWYHVLLEVGGTGDLQVTMTPEKRILIGGGGVPPGESAAEVDFAGTIHWTGPPQPSFFATGYMHHTLQKLSGGHYLSIASEVYGMNVADNVVEFGSDNTVLRNWSTWDHKDEMTPDFPCGNMARLSDDEQTLYYNSTGHLKLYKVDFVSGDILWELGKGGDFSADDPGNTKFWFEISHAPVVLENGNILVYDNGGIKRMYSRLIEYAIDEDSMTASIAWEYPGNIASDYWYEHCWGSVDRLSNGNTLVSAACNDSNSTPSRIFEVTSAGEKALEISLTTVSGTFVGSYMAEKVAVPVGVMPDIMGGESNSQSWSGGRR